MEFLSNNITKILGAILTTLMALIASNSFDGLVSPQAVKWMGIIGTLLGAAVTAVGFNNTTKERVAASMEKAIQAAPGTPVSTIDRSLS